jgi:hypothetical protein
LQTLQIRTVIDLRTPNELRNIDQAPNTIKDGSYRPRFSDYFTHWDKPWEPLTQSATGEDPFGPARRRYVFDIAHVMRQALWNTLSLYTKFVFILLLLTCQKQAATRYAVKNSVFETEGLLAMNKVLLGYAKDEFREMWEVLCEPRSYPVLVHCTAGKDRTGLVIGMYSINITYIRTCFLFVL